MNRVLALALLAAAAACSSSAASMDAQDDADTRDILVRLMALPGLTATEMTPTQAPAGYRYFVLQVTQPVNHSVEGGPTFQQEVSLIHRDFTAPMVMSTTGSTTTTTTPRPSPRCCSTRTRSRSSTASSARRDQTSPTGRS